MQGSGFAPRVALESSDISTAVAFVSMGLGVALVPKSFAKCEQHRIALVDVAGPPLTRRIILAWHDRRYRSRACCR